MKELVQNSIDACRYKEHIKPASCDYIPRIDIRIDRTRRMITVSDNGIGMMEHDIIEYFLQIGKSKTKSQEFKDDPLSAGFNTLARFGIGFWSIFSIAKNANVNTVYNNFHNRKKGLSFEVSLNPLIHFLTLNDSSLCEGTQICLELKDSIDISRIQMELNRAVLVSEIDCRILNENDEQLFIYPKELKEVEYEDIFAYRSAEVTKKGLKLFARKISKSGIEVSLGICYSMINGEYRCLTPEGKPMFDYGPYGTSLSQGDYTAVAGLSTNYRVGPLPFAFERVGRILLNIVNPAGLEYSLSRKVLIENEKLIEHFDIVRRIISELLTEFYEELGVLGNPEKIYQIINDSRCNGGNVSDKYDDKLYDYCDKHFRGLVPLRILKWTRIQMEIKVHIEYMFLNDFWKLKHKVYLTCVSSDRYAIEKQKKAIQSILSSVEYGEGYILWGTEESNALVSVAKSISISKVLPYYGNRQEECNQVVVIEPQAGKTKDCKKLFFIQSKWSGDVVSVSFEKEGRENPWFDFGRSIMYVDVEHELIQHLIELMDAGHVWECGDLLAMMSSRDEHIEEEIRKRTGISPKY